MSSSLAPLLEAVALVQDSWADADGGADLSRAQLIAVNNALGVLRRTTDAVHAEVAAGLARESRRELGPDSLARQQGFRSSAQLIATTTGTSTGDAARLVKLGEATARRTNLLGEVLPAKFPVVRDAMCRGRIAAAAADAIVTFLDRVLLRVGRSVAAEAEELLVEKAAGLSLDEVRKLIARTEAHLDPDGVAPREDELRARTSLSMFQRDGMLHLNGAFAPDKAAPLLAAVHGYVSAEFAAKRDGRDPAAADADRRPLGQIQADALVHLAEHDLSCESTGPLNGATVVVRVDLEDLEHGTGYGLIDGTDQPVSIGTIRRMAADGGVIPWVCGADSEVLDWGRTRRLFTPAQRLALAERDGGCAFCGLPPQMTKAHHIRWWARDTGPTDLTNGILLCETCHHLIHDNAWDIHIDGIGTRAKVWFLPPPHIDPKRTPRPGGRARTELIA
ncbi:HNH endonuclease [Microbacterium sp. ASV81]|uniref:DUF222 domain-containing protein n=1 Tax=Microbacterium capsulatum TaxID=3041921 RepID=A0ABU0XEM3_9MICO|nr:DUF222 domain-containing protein [Microbacterium sp. ASV81]MDQ4213564.1 DUF222 domain-containing protein [Microbacterium sp. ASV81]